MSKVIITITDVPTKSTVNVNVRYPQGKHGPDNSLAESVLHDIKALLAGDGPDGFLLEYIRASQVYGKARLKLVVDNVTEVDE